MKTKYCLALSSLVAINCSQGALLITEFVYDVCNASPLADGSGPNGGEYFVLTNTATTALDISGSEFDDDGDYLDGDGIIFPATTSIPAGGNLLVAAGTQTEWESEYGTLPAGIVFFDSSSNWESLNNGGDSVGISGGDNNMSYADVALQGETAVWDTGSLSFIKGGMASIHPDCGPQTYTPGTAGAAAVAAVPEPSSALFSLLGGTLLIRRKR